MLHKNTLGQLQLKKSGIEAGFAEEREHASRKFSFRNSVAETFTAIVVTGRPASAKARACPHASRRTHAPIGRMRPQSSAMGINSDREINLPVGCIQRSNAPAPVIAP